LIIRVVITRNSEDSGMKKNGSSTDCGGGRLYSVPYKPGLTAGDIVRELELGKVALIFLDNRRISLDDQVPEGACLKILDAMSCGG